MAICTGTSSTKGGFVLAFACTALLGCAVAFDFPGSFLERIPRAGQQQTAEELGILDPQAASPSGEFCSLALSADGKLLATGTFGGGVQLWEAATLSPLTQWQAHDGKVTTLAFSSDSHMLFTSGADLAVKRWAIAETAAPRLAGRWRSPSLVTALAMAPDGRTVAIACDNRLEIHNVEQSDPILESQSIPRASIRALAFAPDGWTIASGGGGDGAVRVWGLEGGQLVLRHTLVGYAETWVRGLVYLNDGGTLISLDTAGHVLAWDRDGRLRNETHAGQPSCLLAALGAGGRLILTKAVADKSACLTRLPERWWH